MANKLLKPKRGKVQNLQKLPVEDGSLIFAYDDNAPSSTVFVEIGERRLALASSYTALADNAENLGGHPSSYYAPASTLNNYADLTAFNGVDSGAINSTVTLTRANGSTVQKVIDEVAHASTAQLALDSSALGGSSLTDITDKIDASTGGGQAFVAAASTDATLHLDRADGNYVELTFNNVANATSAAIAQLLGNQTIGAENLPIYLNQGAPQEITSIPSTFVQPVQLNGTNLNSVRSFGVYYAVGGNTNSNKPNNVDAFALEVYPVAGANYIQILHASADVQKTYSRYYNMLTQTWTTWVEHNRLNTRDLSGYVAAPTSSGINQVWRTDNTGNPYWGTFNDGSLSSLASTITLGDGSGARIDQDSGTYRQRLDIIDNDTPSDAVFSFQQSSDEGANYSTLFTIKDDGTAVASTFEGYLNGTAEIALDSSALGGSSLQNIVDKIDSSTGGGQSFVGVFGSGSSTATFNKADGSTVQFVVNNVAHAGTSDFAHNADTLDGFHATSSSALMSAQSSQMLPTSGAVGQFVINALQTSTLNNFVDIDTAINSTVTLVRANGSSVSKVIDNVAHAGTAQLALDSSALGGSSLQNIVDRIDDSIAANDAMHYRGTIGAASDNPTVTTLPSDPIIGDAYKVISNGTYGTIAAEVGDMLIYDGTAWTLVPSGNDGNVYVGDTQDSNFPYYSNNLVVATGAQKVSSVQNITASAGSLQAIQGSFTRVLAPSATISAISGTLNGPASASTRLLSRGRINAVSGTIMPDLTGMWMNANYTTTTTGYPTTYGNTLTMYDGGVTQLNIGWEASFPGAYFRVKRDSSADGWTPWHRILTGADALTSSAQAIASTNNYFTAGATTQYIASQVDSAVGNYLPLTGGALSGTLAINTATNPQLRLNATTDGDVSIELARGTSSDWKLLNTSGNLHIQSDWDGSKGSYFDVLTLAHTSGDATFKGSVTASTFYGTLAREGKQATWKTANEGQGVLINKTSAAAINSFDPITRASSTSGIWLTGLFQNNYYLTYTSNATISTTANAVDRQFVFNHDGSVTASTFIGRLSGTATNADMLDNYHALNSSALEAAGTTSRIVLAKNIVDYINSRDFATSDEVNAALTWIEF